MTSIWSWLNGISVLILVCFAWVFAIYFTVQYFKKKVKIYPYVAGIGVCMAIGFSGIMVSFIWMLLGNDANETTHITNFLSYSTLGIGYWLLMHLAFEVFFKPKYKKPALILIAIGGVGFYIIIYGFMDIMVSTPKVASGEILDDSVIYFSLAWFAMGILGITVFALLAMSFYRIRKKTKGVIRKKTTYLFWGYAIMSFGVSLDTMVIFDYIFIIRILVTISFYLWYLGFKEENIRPIDSHLKEEIDLDESTMAIIEKLGIDFTRPEDITEEEIIFHREKMICLVCKGKVSRAMYICPDCDTFYCKKCSDTLSTLENACWVCEAPFDESKPVKPFKKEEEVEVEISEKPQKKPKAKK